jgi:hypothetical protein
VFLGTFFQKVPSVFLGTFFQKVQRLPERVIRSKK